MEMSCSFFATSMIWALALGICVGALIMYLWKEKELSEVCTRCDELEIRNERLIKERDEYKKLTSMPDLISDVPDYLRDKYDIPGQESITQFSDKDEDYAEIYI